MCAHWVGGASTYSLFVPQHNLYSLSHHQTLSKPLSEHTQPPKQPARANASGLCVDGCVWFAEYRVSTKHGYGCASVAMRWKKSEVKSSQVDGDLNGTFWRRNGEAKPKKFLSISFRLATEGWGEETREKCKEIFWFLHTRVRERVRGAFHSITTSVERTQKYKATTRSARATSLVLEVGSDLVQ